VSNSPRDRSSGFRALEDLRASVGAVSDQLAAGLDEFGAVAAHFFGGLLAQGFERAEAMQLVVAFGEAHFERTAAQAEPEEEED
jgi:hypothetical protein